MKIYVWYFLQVTAVGEACLVSVMQRQIVLGYSEGMEDLLLCTSRSTRSSLAVPWLKRLVAVLPQRKSGFDPGSVHVGFVVDKVALEQVFLHVNFIPPVIHYLEKIKKN
jgi:hypothetical protein